MPRITDRSSLDTRIQKARDKGTHHAEQAAVESGWAGPKRIGAGEQSHMRKSMAAFGKAHTMRDNHAIAVKAAATRKAHTGGMKHAVAHLNKHT